MKKLFATMLMVLACGAAYALPVGNPSEASLLCDGVIWEGHCGDPCDPCLTWCDAFSLRVGFYGDYVFNRHLQVRDRRVGQRAHIEHFSLYTNAGYLAANLWDRFDIFATLGTTNFSLNTDASTFDGGRGRRLEIESDSDFSWSIGARGTLWECGCTALGIEGQYFSTRPHIKRVSDVFLGQSEYGNAHWRYQEWQVGLGVSHRINMLVPYVAVKWSGVRTKTGGYATTQLTDGILAYNTRNTKSWGYAIGVSLVDCEKAAITVEGRFADEKALYVNGQVRF